MKCSCAPGTFTACFHVGIDHCVDSCSHVQASPALHLAQFLWHGMPCGWHNFSGTEERAIRWHQMQVAPHMPQSWSCLTVRSGRSVVTQAASLPHPCPTFATTLPTLAILLPPCRHNAGRSGRQQPLPFMEGRTHVWQSETSQTRPWSGALLPSLPRVRVHRPIVAASIPHRSAVRKDERQTSHIALQRVLRENQKMVLHARRCVWR